MALSTYDMQQRDHRQSLLSWTLTIILLLLLYAAMKVLGVPRTQAKQKHFFEPLPLQIIDISTLRSAQLNAIPQPRPELMPRPEALASPSHASAMETADPLQFLEHKLSPQSRTPSLPNASADIRAGNPDIALESPSSGVSNIQLPPTTTAVESFRLPSPAQKSPGDPTRPIIRPGNTSEVSIKENSFDPTVKPKKQIDEKSPKEERVPVKLKGPEDIPTDDEFTSILGELIEWMKNNPRALPDVVKTFMGYQPGDLTSKVQAQFADRDVDIFLVCHEKQYEVRICIVDKEKATLLIDKGFKKRSNYFRIGAVNRLENGRIFRFGTSQQSPSDERTREFYQIFMSWWEQVDRNAKE